MPDYYRLENQEDIENSLNCFKEGDIQTDAIIYLNVSWLVPTNTMTVTDKKPWREDTVICKFYLSFFSCQLPK